MLTAGEEQLEPLSLPKLLINTKSQDALQAMAVGQTENSLKMLQGPALEMMPYQHKTVGTFPHTYLPDPPAAKTL